MVYEEVDEIARQAACENVKKIVNAIKLIRIKYYPNFASISEEDQRVFKELNYDLERIASENNLYSLKNTLMSEVEAKYESKGTKEQGGRPANDESKLLACYGAIDVQQQALSEGRIKQALKCQKILEEYLGEIEVESHKELVTKYKREKFGELIRPKEAVQGKIENWTDMLRGFCKSEYTEARSMVSGVISKIMTKGRDEQANNQEKKTDNNELAIG